MSLSGRQVAKVKRELGLDLATAEPAEYAKAFNKHAKFLDFADDYCTAEKVQAWQAKLGKSNGKPKAKATATPAPVSVKHGKATPAPASKPSKAPGKRERKLYVAQEAGGMIVGGLTSQDVAEILSAFFETDEKQG